jgi:hypothetical protein
MDTRTPTTIPPGREPTAHPPPPGAAVPRRPSAWATSEFVSGTPNVRLSSYAEALPFYIDDATKDFGDDLYERMLNDAQVYSCVEILKLNVLGEGYTLQPAVEKPTANPSQTPGGAKNYGRQARLDYDLAKEVADFCQDNLDGLYHTGGKPFEAFLYEMMEALALGNKVAEKVYRDEDDAAAPYPRLNARTRGRAVMLDRLKVKPRRCVRFVVNAFRDVVALTAVVPGRYDSLIPYGFYGADPSKSPANLPRDKFVIFTYNPKDNDPRGHALDPETPIPTPDGWKRLDELSAGSKVFDEQGRIRYVTARQDWNDRPCYRVNFFDGTSIIADANHLWPTRTVSERATRGPGKIRSTEEIAATVRNNRGKAKPLANHGIPWAGALDYPEQVLPVHPYYLGLWLGDGITRNANVAANAWDAEEEAASISGCGYSASVEHNGPEGCNGRLIRVWGGRKWDPTGPSVALRLLGVTRTASGDNKHVPPAYLRGSIQQRLDLLAGLMDSDGDVNKDGGCEFVNTNLKLIRGVAELVRSLGIGASIRVRRNAVEGKNAKTWAVKFTPDFSPFRLARKSERTLCERARKNHYITSVEKVQPRRTVCIEVDGPSHLFLAGESMVPTHNSVLRPAYDPWWNKVSAKPEYAKYLAQFGGPSLFGTTPEDVPSDLAADDLGNAAAGATDSPQDKLLRVLKALRNGYVAVGPDGTKVQVIQASGTGTAFTAAFDFWDKQIAKAVLGQTLATEEGQHQARAAAQVHKDVLDIVLKHVRRAVAVMIRNDVLFHLVANNYGEEDARLYTPKVFVGPESDDDWSSDVAGVSQLVTAAGGQFVHSDQYPYLWKKLGLPPSTQASQPPQPPAVPGQPPHPGLPPRQAGVPDANPRPPQQPPPPGAMPPQAARAVSAPGGAAPAAQRRQPAAAFSRGGSLAVTDGDLARARMYLAAHSPRASFSFDPDQPRGQPGNAGQFGPGAGGAREVIGKGNTGNVYREGDTVVKSARRPNGEETREGEFYGKVEGVVGVAPGKRVGDEIHVPFYQEVLSTDVVPNERDRKSMGDVVAPNKGRLLNAINALSEQGIDYNDPLQVGFDDDYRAHVIDLSNAGYVPPADALRSNIQQLAKFLEDFGAGGAADSVLRSFGVYKYAQGLSGGSKESAVKRVDSLAAKGNRAAEHVKSMGAGKVAGYDVRHVYYSTNPRPVARDVLQSEPDRDGLKVIISDKPLDDDTIRQYSLTAVVHPAKREK